MSSTKVKASYLYIPIPHFTDSILTDCEPKCSHTDVNGQMDYSSVYADSNITNVNDQLIKDWAGYIIIALLGTQLCKIVYVLIDVWQTC